jgi:hypothetical protein
MNPPAWQALIAAVRLLGEAWRVPLRTDHRPTATQCGLTITGIDSARLLEQATSRELELIESASRSKVRERTSMKF